LSPRAPASYWKGDIMTGHYSSHDRLVQNSREEQKKAMQMAFRTGGIAAAMLLGVVLMILVGIALAA
jgi:hypothetical protein